MANHEPVGYDLMSAGECGGEGGMFDEGDEGV
jgi:hypothetical protein